jgi:hypothetical protein
VVPSAPGQPAGGVPEGRVPFIAMPAGGVPHGWEVFPFMPAGGVPEGLVVFPCISAGGVPDGVGASEPDKVAAACWAGVLSACDGTEDTPADEDADVLPLSCVQPAMKIPATRIADAMIMMIVLFFMRFRVSISFVVNTVMGPGPWIGPAGSLPV